MTTYTEFVETHNAKMVEQEAKNFDQLLKFAARHLKELDELKSYTITQLVEVMKGGDAPVKKTKKGAKNTKKAAKGDDESEELDYPKGMTKERWVKCCAQFALLEDGEHVNVMTGKRTKKTDRNKNTFYWRKRFCAPLVKKPVVLWAANNQPVVEEPEDEDVEFEEIDEETEPLEDDDIEFSGSEDEDEVPPKRRKKAEPESDDEDDDEEEEEDESPPKRKRKGKAKSEDESEEWWTDGKVSFGPKEMTALRKAAAKAKSSGGFVNAKTRRSCATGKKDFVYIKKRGYAVEKKHTDLKDVIDEHW